VQSVRRTSRDVMYHLFGAGGFLLLCVVEVFAAVGANLELHDRIVGGTPAVIEEFPYQISLQYNGKHICGGSIIGSFTVLTAAHCVHNLPRSQLTVFAGSTFYNGGAKHNVAIVRQHKFYNDDTSDYDIAVIKVTVHFKVGPTIQPIALPAQNEVVPKTMGIVTGWGYTKEDGAISRSLMQVSVPIIDRKRCRTMYNDEGVVTLRMICAGYVDGGRDSCQGDSGGPLVIHGKLVGVVSWGYGCARTNHPGVYVKVSKFINWIKTHGPL